MKAIMSVPPGKGQKASSSDYNTISQRELAFRGLCRVVSAGDSFFGTGKGYRGKLLRDPSWRMMLGEASRMIEATGDDHHVFLEGVYVASAQPEPGVVHLSLMMGS